MARRPTIRVVRAAQARPGEVAGVGDRALLRVDPRTTKTTAIRYTGRVIKLLDRAKQRVLGIFRALPSGGGRARAGRQEATRPRTRDPAGRDATARRTAISSPSRCAARTRRPAAAHACARRSARSRASSAVSLIAIHAHGIPHVFPRERSRRGGSRASRRSPRAARTGASCRSSPSIRPTRKDHDDAVHAEPDDDPDNRGGHMRHRRHRRRCALCAARLGARPRGAACAATRSTFPIASCRCCRSASRTISARCGRTKTAPALAVRMIIDADGRKRSHTFHRVLMRSHAKLSYQQAQAAIDGQPDDVDRSRCSSPFSSRSMPLTARSSGRAMRASRSTSTCPSARSCSSPTAPSTASYAASASMRTG